MKNVLVVDDDVELVKSIQDYFISNNSINIKYVAYDGEEGLKLLKNNKDIDLILLDLVMPKKDGFAFLEYIRKKDIEKTIIVMTAFNSDKVIRRCVNLGIDYIMIKPFDLKDLENRILNINEIKSINNKDLKINLTKLLHELGVPSNIKGYEYIREGINYILRLQINIILPPLE